MRIDFIITTVGQVTDIGRLEAASTAPGDASRALLSRVCSVMAMFPFN
jgi:hypothetical protein